MWHVALRPKFLGLLALMLAAATVCGFLATWQWDRAHRFERADRAASEAAAQKPAALDSVLAPSAPFPADANARVVVAEGRFDPDRQVLVPGRNIDGEDAILIVTALEVDDASTSGSAILPVVRGWVTDEDDPAVRDVPSGEVDATGYLQVSESSSASVPGSGKGEIGSVSTSELVNLWGGPMYSGYLAVDRPLTDTAGTEIATSAREMPEASNSYTRGLNFQNVGYALQWIVFGGFALYLWWRMVRDEYRDELAAAAATDRAEPDRPLSPQNGSPSEPEAPREPETKDVTQ